MQLIRLLLLLACLACGAVRAADPPEPITLDASSPPTSIDGHAQSWIEDGRSRTIEQVAEDTGIPWRVRPAGQQDRLDGRALWLRFPVKLQPQAGRWYLAVNSSGIDRVQMFHRDASGRWVTEEAGDSKPVSQWPLPGRAPTFELEHPPSAEPVTYWLRVEHDRVDFAAPIVLYSQGELLAAREREQFMFGCYFGVAMLLALVAAASAAIWRDRNFAAYTVYLVIFTLGQAAYLGIGAQHLWDEALDWNAQSTFVLPGLSAAAALWFVHVVTEPARFSHWLQRIVVLLVAALLVSLVIDTFMPSRTTLGIRLALTTLALAVVIALIGIVWTRGDDPDIRVIALGWVPVLVMALFPIARGFNLIPNGILTRYGLAIGAAIEMPILFYALNLRAARRREAQLRASALPRTDALTGLADRRSLLLRLDDSLARARSLEHSCALMLVKLSNHDQISSEYGRDTLDRALIVTGAYMRRAANDIDLAARVGDREFALLIEGPTTADAVGSRAQQVVAWGLRQTQALPPDVVLRLSVAVAMLPDEQPDAETTLQWLSVALAAIRPDARKQIRSVNF